MLRRTTTKLIKMGTEGRRIYVGGLPYKADERDLRDLCNKYGRIEDGEYGHFVPSPNPEHSSSPFLEHLVFPLKAVSNFCKSRFANNS